MSDTKEKSVLKAMYHVHTAMQYFQGVKGDFKGAFKLRIQGWIDRLNYIENDVSFALTEESRELYREEILKGDVLFFSDVQDKLIDLNPQQRTLIEDLVNAMLSGKPIMVEEVDKEAVASE